MNSDYYLDIFKKAANQLDKKTLTKKQVEVATGLYGKSVFIKLYKTAWANPAPNPLTAESRIFFSVWISDKAIKEQRLFYNIHALKLRKLPGYSIASRAFASAFRERFDKLAHQWPNVSTEFGPLTLMEGWVIMDAASVQTVIAELANKFLEIDYLIDDILADFKK